MSPRWGRIRDRNDPSKDEAKVNKRLASDYGDWAGKGAAIIGLLILLGLVHGRKWTQAHTALAGTATALYLISQL
jgi:hypothetical protein